MTEQEHKAALERLLASLQYGDKSIVALYEQSIPNADEYLYIKAGNKRLAVILFFEAGIGAEHLQDDKHTELYFVHRVRYVVYVVNDAYLVYDRFEIDQRHKEYHLEEFARRVSMQIPTRLLNKVKLRAVEVIEEVALENAENIPWMINLVREMRQKIISDMKLSMNYTLYIDNQGAWRNHFENVMFRMLLNVDERPERIYRYAGFDRVFSILNKNEIAMHGLAGMNDTTETNYVDNYLNDSHDQFWEMPSNVRSEINRRFISSCTISDDELLQWRLYGDDARGACIVFKVNTAYASSDRFILGRVSYADEHKHHPELYLLKTIITRIRSTIYHDYRFIMLYIWRHFFKPHDYEYEKEIRLLYLYNSKTTKKEWIVAGDNKIVNPMVKFPLNKKSFPLSIERVVLGSKKADKELTRYQLEQMLSEKRSKIKVGISRHEVYR